MITLTPRSRALLSGVHPDLVRVVQRAAADSTDLAFVVLEGLRTLDRQVQLVKAGASQTLRSRHLTGHAVDLGVWLGGELRWDWPLYDRLAGLVLKAAQAEGVPVEWGGHWVTLRDGPHFQLPRDRYPAAGERPTSTTA